MFRKLIRRPVRTLRIQDVRRAESDDAIFEMLGCELERLLPKGRRACDEFVRELRRIPRGLRAMAATYELDVSLTLDDLGWHFGNWHHKGLAMETIEGLIELELPRLAEIFEFSFREAEKYWDELSFEDWMDWYHTSPLEPALDALNWEVWDNRETEGYDIFAAWVRYARKYPERLF